MVFLSKRGQDSHTCLIVKEDIVAEDRICICNASRLFRLHRAG